MAELTPEEIRGPLEGSSSPWRQLLAAIEENERLERRAAELVAAMDPRSVTVMLRQERDEARVKCVEQATTIATLEGIVRRLLGGWFEGGYEWVKKDSASPTGAMFRVPMSDAEALILKEMQQ